LWANLDTVVIESNGSSKVDLLTNANAVYIPTYIRLPNFAVLGDLSVSTFQLLACFQGDSMVRLPSPPPLFFATYDYLSVLDCHQLWANAALGIPQNPLWGQFPVCRTMRLPRNDIILTHVGVGITP